jgi:tetratricopeptide (TPR) repeat protein
MRGCRLLSGIGLLLAALWLAAAAGMERSDGESISQLYRRSPADAHRRLKRQVLQGGVPRAEVETVARQTGDRSFTALQEADFQLRGALELQELALREWEAGRHRAAVRGYEAAVGLLDPRKHRSELAFCQYFIAEILAEEELYAAGLARLDAALALAEGERFHYLEALVQQSRGYSLWFLDRLPESSRAFAAASRLWKAIGFDMGRLACSNNLAALYEELGLDAYAEAQYLEALSQVNLDTYPEIRLQAVLNFARFLHRRGENERSRRFLRLAACDRAAAEAEFKLAQAEIEGRLDLLPESPAEPSAYVQSELLRLRHAAPGKGNEVGRLRELRGFCRRHGLRLQERVVSQELGRELERRGEWESAAAVYADAILRADVVVSPAWVFPFPEALAPHLAGWVRSLVRSGRPLEALERIRSIAAARARLLEAANWEGANPGNAEDEWEVYARLGTAAAGTGFRELPTVAPLLPPSTTRVELWPDGNSVLAWIQHRGGTRFVSLPGVVDDLAGMGLMPQAHTLPPVPSAGKLERLSRSFLQPLADCLQGSRLVLVPHGTLQQFPFELLVDGAGIPLVERRTLSYQPPGFSLPLESAPPDETPLAVVPEAFRSREGGRREREFLEKGAVRLVPSLDGLPHEVRARWLYWSSHLIPHPRFWHLSRLTDGRQELRLFELVRRRLRCRLLVLATCDGGRVQAGYPRDWLGLSALLLSRGSSSVLLSRWQLDERAVQILLDTMEGVEAGRAVDESLATARRAYLARCGQDPVCSHPFYWAGILYVGPPGLRAGPQAGVAEAVAGAKNENR